MTLVIGLIGQGGVGKTSFIDRLTGHRFEPRYYATRGHQDTPLFFECHDIILRDFSGQDVVFEDRRLDLYKDVDAFLVMASDSMMSLKRIPFLIKDISKPFLVVINKSDITLRHRDNEILKERLVDRYGIDLKHISAKNKMGLEESLVELLTLIECPK